MKRHDLNNNKPLFREIADDDDGGPAADTTALTYTVTKPENATGIERAFDTAHGSAARCRTIANPDGTDNDEDDSDREAEPVGLGDDRLTYSLSGADAKYFVIVGSVDHPTSYDTTPDDDEDDGKHSISGPCRTRPN